MKKKLTLRNLKVTSLPVGLNSDEQQQVKGGIKYQSSIGVSISHGRFWTVTETRASEQSSISRAKGGKNG